MRFPRRSVPCSMCGAPRAFVSGKYIRDSRRAAGLSLRELARRLNFTPSYISDMELDKRYISEAMAKRMLKALR